MNKKMEHFVHALSLLLALQVAIIPEANVSFQETTGYNGHAIRR
jgi:hypothetical protein